MRGSLKITQMIHNQHIKGRNSLGFCYPTSTFSAQFTKFLGGSNSLPFFLQVSCWVHGSYIYTAPDLSCSGCPIYYCYPSHECPSHSSRFERSHFRILRITTDLQSAAQATWSPSGRGAIPRCRYNELQSVCIRLSKRGLLVRVPMRWSVWRSIPSSRSCNCLKSRGEGW